MKVKFSLKEIKRITGAVCASEASTRLFPEAVTGVSIDSRTVEPGELFVALRGAAFDGHDFVSEALSRGASLALVSRNWTSSRPGEELARPLLAATDTLMAFQELGRYNRVRVNPKVVAVTGSNGKTTTKDMIADVSSTTYVTARTRGNLNNHFGVPITLMSLLPGDEVAVVEMGMNHPGEIRRLASLCMPSVGVITNASAAHLEGMGTVHEVAKAKSELAEELDRNDWLIIHRDSEDLYRQNRTRRCRLISFGMTEEADVFPREVRYCATGCTELSVDGFPPIRIPLLGKQNALNALAALAASRALGIDPERAAGAFAMMRPARGRMEMKSIGPASFIDDSYNANPASMKMALETLFSMKGFERKIAVLGDMLELGETSQNWHIELGKEAGGADLIILYGQFAGAVRSGAEMAGKRADEILVLGSHGEIAEKIASIWKEHDLFLIKGSRSVGMEKILGELERRAGTSSTAQTGGPKKGF